MSGPLTPPPYRPRATAAELDAVWDALAPSLGERRLRRDEEALLTLSSDESGAGAYPAQLAAWPETTAEVSQILAACARHGVPVVPRGAGTGRSGGALPIHGGLVLCLGKMNTIQAITPASMIARAQPGVITGELQAAVEAEGLFYPPDPNSLESCHLGGNVATNAAGPRAVKYGVTRDYVLGLTAVRMGGEVITTGKQSLKGVAGYDLTSLLVGSEGTLGVITDITVRLRPRPPRVETALAFFDSLAAACRAVVGLFQAGHAPRTLEMMDPVAIDAVRGKTPFRFPEGEQAALILEADGEGDAVFEELVTMASRLTERFGATDVLVAKNSTERRDLWAARRIMSPSLREQYGYKYSEDIAVPLAAIPDMAAACQAIAAEHGLDCALYGHAGDGNLHVNLLFRDPSAWDAVHRAALAIFRATLERGGTITGEHGVGLLKRGVLPLEQGPEVIALQRALKAQFDPAGLMNPGKVFPAE